MADEFVKGFGIFTGGMLVWMTLAAWYRTSTFGGRQFTEPIPEELSTNEFIGVLVMETAFWFAILGALTFWVLIPVGRELRSYVQQRRSVES